MSGILSPSAPSFLLLNLAEYADRTAQAPASALTGDDPWRAGTSVRRLWVSELGQQ